MAFQGNQWHQKSDTCWELRVGKWRVAIVRHDWDEVDGGHQVRYSWRIRGRGLYIKQSRYYEHRSLLRIKRAAERALGRLVHPEEP